MEFINLTPHPVIVGQRTFPPSGTIARCEEFWYEAKRAHYDGVPVVHGFKYDNPNLPEFKTGTIYIVSLPVAMSKAAAHRIDLVVPIGQLRDESGKIIGATALAFIDSNV